MTLFERHLTDEDPVRAAGEAPPETGRRGVLRIIWNRRMIVLVSTLVLTVGSFAYVELATPLYVGGARLLVQQQLPKVLAPTDSPMPGDMRNGLYTECEVIRSWQVLNDALQSQGVAALPTFKNDTKEALSYMMRHLTVTPGKQDDLITVAFETPYPDDVPKVVTAVVDAYTTFQTAHRRDIARDVRDILERERTRGTINRRAAWRRS